MKILVSGSRHWQAMDVVKKALQDAIRPLPVQEEVILLHGGRSGAEAIAAGFGKGMGITIRAILADFKKNQAWANAERDERALKERPDILLAFPTRLSDEVWDVIRMSHAIDIPVKVYDEKAGEVFPMTPEQLEAEEWWLTGGVKGKSA